RPPRGCRRHGGARRGAPAVRAPAARRVQAAALGRVRPRAAEDRDGKDSALPAALAGGPAGLKARRQKRSAFRTALTPSLTARATGEDEPARRLALTSTVCRGSTCTRRTSAA